MGMLARLLGRGAVRQSATWSDDIARLLRAGTRTRSGVEVSHLTALQVSAVMACVRVISEGVAQLPFHLFRKTADGRGSERVADHPVALVLDQPNDFMTRFELRELLLLHATLTGRGIAVITRVGGQVRELLPVRPSDVTIEVDAAWNIRYRVTWPKGGVDVFGPAEVIDLRGPSWDGIVALDMVRHAREAIGLAIAAERTAAGMFGNAGIPSGVLSTDGNLKPEQARDIGKAWRDSYGGENAGGVAVLWAGMKWTPVTMSAADAQLTAQREFQLQEAARVFRVFPHMIGLSDKASTYASAEAFFSAHVVHTLGPWIERLEQRMTKALLTPQERRGGYYIKASVQGLLRGNAKDRAAFYGAGINDGWMTRNEARALEDLNPLDGLDVPLRPLNMTPGDAPADEPPDAPPDAPQE